MNIVEQLLIVLCRAGRTVQVAPAALDGALQFTCIVSRCQNPGERDVIGFGPTVRESICNAVAEIMKRSLG